LPVDCFKNRVAIEVEWNNKDPFYDRDLNNFRLLYDSVNEVLLELNASEKHTITVLNKIDKIEDKELLDKIKGGFENAVCMSAKTAENINDLQDLISQLVSTLFVEINVNVPINRMDLVNLAHEEGEVYSVKYYNDKINIRASIPSSLTGRFQLKK